MKTAMTIARIRPLPGVSALVLRDGKVLLVKRAKKAGFGMWSLPGGHIEPGEPAREAVLRELLEETSVTAEVDRLFDCIDIIHRDPSGGLEFHYVISCFKCNWQAGEPRPGDDVSDARWVRIEEFESLTMTPGTDAFLRRALDGFT
jgi:8-oxo-dGTP diphosphatase